MRNSKIINASNKIKKQPGMVYNYILETILYNFKNPHPVFIFIYIEKFKDLSKVNGLSKLSSY